MDVLVHKRQGKWWESTKRDFHVMESKGVCKICPVSFMPHRMSSVGNRWVLTEQDDGTYRSRTVAEGFSQLPEKYYTDSHAPVMTNLAFRLAHIIKVLRKLPSGQINLELAFMYSE
jgi:Reverse transcriptase (RNA-dependent DNA polymerase)